MISTVAAGPATTGHPWLLVAGLALITLFVYTAACWFWPYTSCGKCAGAGRFLSPTGKNWRKCPKCKGSPARLRTGRRVLNSLGITKTLDK